MANRLAGGIDLDKSYRSAFPAQSVDSRFSERHSGIDDFWAELQSSDIPETKLQWPVELTLT
jgi:hypothetical protein